MSINVKKYTKDQMAKMVEEATERQEAAEGEEPEQVVSTRLDKEYYGKLAEENEKLRGEIGTLTEKLDQMNGEAITRENEIANLKADADVLRNKLADTEAALGRANDDLAFKGTVIDVMRDKRYNAEQRANYAESHPWRNLWAWVKRKLKMA